MSSGVRVPPRYCLGKRSHTVQPRVLASQLNIVHSPKCHEVVCKAVGLRTAALVQQQLERVRVIFITPTFEWQMTTTGEEDDNNDNE